MISENPPSENQSTSVKRPWSFRWFDRELQLTQMIFQQRHRVIVNHRQLEMAIELMIEIKLRELLISL